MASKKNRKPAQEIYRPPKSNGNGDKAHERTFYNSNHKKKTYKMPKEEFNTNQKRFVNDEYQYADHYPVKYDGYNARMRNNYEEPVGNYRDRRRYNNDRDIYCDGYYENYSKPNRKYEKDSYLNADKYYQNEEKNKNRNYNSYKNGENFKINSKDKREHYYENNRNSNLNSAAGHDMDTNVNRSRHNSHNKDYNDSRLFNPYKSESSTTVTHPSQHQNNEDVYYTQAHFQPNAVSNKHKQENDKPDSHIHGGLIHLPDNIAIKNASSANNHSHSTGASDYLPNKPTVMVRPTFSQLTPVSTSIPFSVPMVHGIQTATGFIPVQPAFLTPLNYMRQTQQQQQQHQLQPITNDYSTHIINTVRYNPPTQSIIHNTDDITQIASNMNVKNPLIGQTINKIRILETQLDVFICSSCDIISDDWWNSVNQIRSELMELYRYVISNDLNYCNQANIEQNLWKSVFYSVMELIRNVFVNYDTVLSTQSRKTAASAEEVKEYVINQGQSIIKSGENYFINLYTEISKPHGVNLELIFNSRRPPPETRSRTRKLIYLSAQKLLLFLGDLARYSEIINSNSDYSKARLWYLKAQLLVPKNGRPYNQLAVISIYASRHLDALYYYIRTLAASNPFSTASQCLSFLFEDARCKADELARKKLEILKKKKKKQNIGNGNTNIGGGSVGGGCGGGASSSNKGCIEIWIHPEDGSREKNVKGDDDTDILATFSGEDNRYKAEQNQIREDYLSMPIIELNKLFILSFIHSHGKLFVRINMDTFPEVCSSMLQELSAMLSHQPCPLKNYRLCHMLIINMYIMDRVCQPLNIPNVIQQNQQPNYTLRSLHQDHASRMTLDFFAILCQRAIELLTEWIDTSETIALPLQLPSDLSNLLPAICLWTDWMVTHPEYWNPPPNQRDPLLPPNINDFQLIAQLCTIIYRICSEHLPPNSCQRPKFRIITDIKEAEKLIGDPNAFILSEENLISGFLPMLDQIPKIYLIEDSIWSKEQIEDFVHLEKIYFFGDFLCGIVPPLLDYNVESCSYKSMIVKEGSERQQDEPDDQKLNDIFYDDVTATGGIDAESSGDIGEMLEQMNLNLKKEIDQIHTDHNCNQSKDSSIYTSTSNYPASMEMESWADITEQEEKEKERKHQEKIAQLKIKRARVNTKEAKETLFNAWRHSFFDKEFVQKFVEIQIRPLFLVLDTNCYIDYLNYIDLLHTNGRFIIVVPLIVVNELEFLKKSTQPKDDVDINTRAQNALRFIEDKFDRANPNFKAITSQGNFMETIAYRSEIINLEAGQSNDDVILKCCQFLCKDKPSEFMPREKDKPVTLHREVVLLTGDSNLRLKALSKHIPVKALKCFIEWATPNNKKSNANR